MITAVSLRELHKMLTRAAAELENWSEGGTVTDLDAEIDVRALQLVVARLLDVAGVVRFVADGIGRGLRTREDDQADPDVETIRLGTIGQTLGVVTSQLDAVTRGFDYARQDLAAIQTARISQEAE